jgi:predicted nucleic acid-binding protein
MFVEDFERRVPAFDTQAATAYAEIFAPRRGAGRPVTTVDLMVAAIARSQGASVVTRNVADFAQCGVGIMDPWAAEGG